MNRLYRGLGFGLIVLGAVHMVSAFVIFDQLSGPAVSFVGAGVAIALTGALNILNASYGHQAPGLSWTCKGTNVGMTVFGIVAGVATRASVIGFVIVLGLLGGVTLLSMLPRAVRPSAQRAA